MYGITFVILAITRSHTHIYINVVQYCRCPYRLELMKYKQASINIISTWLYSRIQGRQGRHRIMIHYSWASIPHYPHTLLILTPHPYRENLPGMKTRVCAGHFKQKPQPLFPLYLSLHFFFCHVDPRSLSQLTASPIQTQLHSTNKNQTQHFPFILLFQGNIFVGA